MSYIGQGLPADVFSGYTIDKFTGTGVASQALTLTKAPFSETAVLVTIDGVVQEPTDDFTVSGTTLTIVGTAPLNSEINVTHIAGAVAVGEASKLDTKGVSDTLILDADADTTISADTDDQIDFKAGGTDIMSLTATSATFNDGVEIIVDDNSNTLKLTCTDADATNGPTLRLFRDSASPADADFIGRTIFSADNDAGEETNFAEIDCQIDDASDGTEDGQLFLRTIVDGTTRNRMGLYASSVVFNDDSRDIDFRVETDTSAYGLYLQATHGGNSGGTLGVGTNNPDGNFFEAKNPQSGVYTTKSENSASSGNLYNLYLQFSGQAPDNNSSYFISAADSSAGRFQVLADGDVRNHDNSYGSISDERIKSEIVDANSQWDDIKALRVRNYKKNDDIAKYGDAAWVQLGVIAQELEAAGMDKCVKQEILYTADDQETKDHLYTQKDKDLGMIPEGKDVGDVQIAKTANVGDIKEYKGVKYSILYMKAIKALQEAMAKIETLETKVQALEDA